LGNVYYDQPIEWVGLKLFLRVILVPQRILIPVILVLCTIGAYALNNIMENVWTFYLFGIIGYLMVKFEFPLAPIIIGVVLGDQLETNLIRSLMTDDNLALFFTRPISGLLLLASLASLVVSLWQRWRRPRAPGWRRASGRTRARWP